MISRKLTSFGKPSLLILGAVVLFLSATHALAANSPNDVTTKVMRVVVNDDSKNVASAKEVKRSLLRLINRKVKTNAKVASLPTGCRCAVAVEELGGGFRQCFDGCLERAGVSAIQIGTCAGSCAGSLVACAVCLGITEWVVMGCGQYCAWKKVIGWEYQDVRLRRPPSRNRGSQQARFGLKRIPAAA